MCSSGKPLYTLLCFCNHFGFSFRWWSWWWKKVLGSTVCSVQPCASNIDSGCSRTNMWWTGYSSRWAISHLPYHDGTCLFYTDSSAAIDLIHKTLGANCVSQFSHLEHLDLLLPIWETRNNHSCTLHKVKTHLEAASFSDPIEAYECLGNKLANDTAQQVNTVFCLSMVSELEALHKRNSADKQRLEQVVPWCSPWQTLDKSFPLTGLHGRIQGLQVMGVLSH